MAPKSVQLAKKVMIKNEKGENKTAYKIVSNNLPSNQ